MPLLLLASCAWDEPWSFGATRATWGSDDWMPDLSPSSSSRFQEEEGRASERAGFLVGCVLLGPFLIDAVLLPVTLPHDLLFAD